MTVDDPGDLHARARRTSRRVQAPLPLLGWWSHIVIDVFTHSADCYAVPVLCPLTERGFDGMAWTTPWFMVPNDVALVAVGAWLLSGRKRPAGD